MKIGNQDILGIYLGNQSVSKVYIGETVVPVFPKE